MSRLAHWVGASLAIAAALVACGARTGLLAPEPAEAGPDAARRKDATPDVAPDVPLLDVSKQDVFHSDCPDADSTLVYVVSENNELLSFYPPTASFKLIGMLSCPDPGASPFSMAVDRKGVAYVEYDDGKLFKVSTANASCQPTTFVPNQGPFSTFGMGYATIGVGPAEELFIASGDGVLGKVDTTNFSVTTIGPFVPQLGRAELTGTGDGRLYAFVVPANVTSGSAVAEIDKTTADVLGEDPLPQVEQGTAWAFAFWGGDFWLFTDPSPQTTWRYDPVAKTATVVANYSSPIVGAGVSTCAPQ